MSNAYQPVVLTERTRDIGGFTVGRLLPTSKKRMIGPFIFIDHMGPATVGPQHYLDVNQHPHIGLSTLTYLLEGEIVHRDSLGNEQRITPDAVNWMDAGHGITHTERTPTDMRDGKTHTVHGFQIWIALPKQVEHGKPVFHHINKADLPIWDENGAELTLVAGTGFGHTSPVPVHSPMFMIKVRTRSAVTLELTGALQGEIGLIPISNQLSADNKHAVSPGELLVSTTEQVTNVHFESNSEALLVGGIPFPEKRYIHWNFVSSNLDEINIAKQRWIDKAFPKVPDDSTYVPLPEAM